MENGNIIYEKKFAHLTPNEFDLAFTQQEPDATSGTSSVFPDRFKRIIESTVQVMIPERIDNRGVFIAMAKEFSAKNEIDTVITEYADRLIADFSIGCDSTSLGLKALIDYVDDISFQSEGSAVVISLIYYTHALYRNGKKIAPDNGINFLV